MPSPFFSRFPAPALAALALALAAAPGRAAPAVPTALGAFERGVALETGERHLGASVSLTPLLMINGAAAGFSAALGSPLGEFRLAGTAGGRALLLPPIGLMIDGDTFLAGAWKGRLLAAGETALALKLQAVSGSPFLRMPGVATLSLPFETAWGGLRLLAEPGLLLPLSGTLQASDAEGAWPLYAYLGAQTSPWGGLSLNFGARVQPGAWSLMTFLPTAGVRWTAGPMTYELGLLDLYPSDFTRLGSAGLFSFGATYGF